MDLFLRCLTSRDYEVIASWVRTPKDCERWAGPHMRFPFTAEELPALIAGALPVVEGESRESFVLCRPPDEVVGYGELVREDGPSFRLARIVVSPERRRGGLGLELCRQLIERARAHPAAQCVRLFVYRDNDIAIRLYSRIGFVEAPVHPRAEIMAMERRI